jgi:hypothetical protein
MGDIKVENVAFPNGNQARLLQAPRDASARQILDALAIPDPRAVLILNGGTAQLEAGLQARLDRLLGDGLARVVAEEGITAVTGATDAGIFSPLGRGLARWGRRAPCLGVAVAGLVVRPDHPQGEASLEPHHSHFVLVDGQDWGDETETMYALVAALARSCRSVALFAGGGGITLREMRANVHQGRGMIFLAGSGRNTDAVLAVRQGGATENERLKEIADGGDITPFAVDQSPAALRELVRRTLL